jgi:serine protease Do
VKKPSIALAALLFLGVPSLTAAEDRKERVLNDRKEVEASGNWIYNDLPKGFAEAARTGKPLLIVIRCIP